MSSPGKTLHTVEKLEKKENFQAIPLLEPLIPIPTDIAHRMSTDSSNAWKVLQAVTAGHLPAEVAALKIGDMNHSRYAMEAFNDTY